MASASIKRASFDPQGGPVLSRLSFLCAIALVAIAAVVAGCGGGEDRSDESPQQIIDEATLQGIDKADVDLTFTVDAPGKEGGDLDVSLSGPFETRGKGDLPNVDIELTAKGDFDGDNIDFDGGVTLLPNQAYVQYEGVEYEVDETSLSFVESILQPVGPGGEELEGRSAAACQEEVGKLEVGEFVENGKNEGSADVGGTSTTKVSGDLDVQAALDSMIEISESPACRAQAETAGPLPSKKELEEAKQEVRDSLKEAHVDVYVGDDNIVRRIDAQLKLDAQKSGGDGPEKADVDFDLTLTGVNEEQEIAAPQNAEELSDLFGKLGINPLELLGLLQGGGIGGLDGVLDGLGGLGGGEGKGGNGNDSGGGPGAYLDCLQEAKTPSDLQSCAGLQ